MRCAFCQSPETKVVDKRDTEGETRRRRECLTCRKRFTTYEKAYDVQLRVVKKDGRREAFDPEKLKRGFLKACEKRPIPVEKIDAAVEKIDASLRKLKAREIKSSIIGEKVMGELKKLDNVAYIRFASVYKEFKDVDDFRKEIKAIKG